MAQRSEGSRPKRSNKQLIKDLRQKLKYNKTIPVLIASPKNSKESPLLQDAEPSAESATLEDTEEEEEPKGDQTKDPSRNRRKRCNQHVGSVAAQSFTYCFYGCLIS